MEGADRDLFERSLRHATERHTGAALDVALAELGWRDALTVDRRAAVSTLFELQGEECVTSSALDAVVLNELGLLGTAVVLPALGEWRPPGVLDKTHVRVHGLATAGLATAAPDAGATALVVARTTDKDVAVVVDVTDLVVRPVRGIDPGLGLVAVTGDIGATDPQPADWRRAVALGQLAVGHELVGAARRMLELACHHALERVQFGQPISTFQAVRHRLADTLVAIEMADAGLDAAWADLSLQTSAMAKALAGRGARTAARHCQQVLAGIGFTTEHPFHRCFRRVMVLDGLFGGARTLTNELGEELLRSRQLPPLLPL